MLMAVACATGLMLAVCAVAPEPAAAIDIPNPLDAVPDFSNMGVEAFKGILEYMFGEDIDKVGKRLVSLLLAVPMLSDKDAFPGLNQYRSYVWGGSWGVLMLSFVISSMQYWLSSGQGVYDGLVGFFRTVVAIAAMLVFVPAFDLLSRILNAFTSALVVNPIVGDSVAKGFGETLTLQVLSNGGIAMLIGLAGLVMACVLLVVKVIVLALLAVLFVASPLAIALWPIEATSHYMRLLLQAIFALLSFPLIWALCFGVFTTLSVDALFPGDHGSTLVDLLAPLLVLALLIIMFRLPFKVLDMGLQAGIAPGIGRGVAQVRSAGFVVSAVRGRAPVAK